MRPVGSLPGEIENGMRRAWKLLREMKHHRRPAWRRNLFLSRAICSLRACVAPRDAARREEDRKGSRRARIKRRAAEAAADGVRYDEEADERLSCC